MVGIKNKVDNHVISMGTQGASNLFSYAGKNVKNAEDLVVATYVELLELNL